MPHTLADPVIDYRMRQLCVRSYSLHPKGCPNYNKKKGCPPQTSSFDVVYDMGEVYAIYNIFNFKQHIDMMKARHPTYSQRQLECCLYWQPKARKQLEQEIKKFTIFHCGEGFDIIRCPEAMDVNITETMKRIGVGLEWPPVTKTLQVALTAKRRK